MNKKIVFTGGGSAGHVTPNIALIQSLQEKQWQMVYIGSTSGMEENMVKPLHISYKGVVSGKLRRYFSWQNFIDPFKILYGIFQSYWTLGKIKPTVVFSKGGFVAFPVVVAAWLRCIPVIAHESDLTPGLANKLSFPFVKYICVTFDEGKKYFKNTPKVVVTGTPIRLSLLSGNKEKAKTLCGFDEDKPTLLIIGGGQGSLKINQVVREALTTLTTQYQIIHLCGEGKVDKAYDNVPGYCQFSYVDEALADLFALADIVVSRSGANTVYEILSLKKPHLFIPLPLTQSRGDQIVNANHFKKLGISHVLNESELNKKQLLAEIDLIEKNKITIVKKIAELDIHAGTESIIKLIESCCK